MDILIFGTGAVSDILVNEYLDLEHNRILAYVNSVTDTETEKNGYAIISLDKAKNYTFDYILIAAGRYDKMFQECVNSGISENKIVGIIPDESRKMDFVQEHINKDIGNLFNLNNQRLFKKELPGFCKSTLYFGNELWLDENKNIFKKYEQIDIQRSMMLRTVSREIISRNIVGNVAELGVYQGDFAKIINELFPEKKLYLFDTFGGFQESDLTNDKNKFLSKQSTAAMFKDTTIELVLSKMPNKNKCEIVKGFFPKSAEGLEDTFAFVSIDADLYEPIYEGLQYFYKRLSSGGYIFVHDFNNAYFSGARKAVMNFCDEEKIGYIPITDYNGSVIIAK
jgi:hypothetical protein